MSRKVSFLEKLGLGGDTMSSLLPQYNSPPRRPSNDLDLDEIEPRPDDALLHTNYYDSPKMPPRNSVTDSEMLDSSSPSSAWATSKGKGKGKGKAVAIAYQGHPGSWQRHFGKPSFVPPIPRDITEGVVPEHMSEAPSELPSETSIIDSIIPRRIRPNEMPTNLRLQVDDTFRGIALRERQMQKELQRLLDAQAAAIEQKLNGSQFGGQEKKENIGTVTSNNKKRQQSLSSTSDSLRAEQPSRQHIVPVRQPPERRLTLGQTRSRIIGVMRMLADLKAEEDAYIATALAERKAGLSKLGTLKTRHQQITHDIYEIEKDPNDPLTNDIRTIERELHDVSGQIEQYKRLLRRAEQAKATLERRLEETRSEAESRLSGYKGALRECEAGIKELVRRPGIRVLELEQQQLEAREDSSGNAGGNDGGRGGEGGLGVTAAADQHITGFEFFRLRPERRTLLMARDWWEGEVAALERRRAAVETECAALEEGERIWADVIDTIQQHEEQLTGALGGRRQRPASPPVGQQQQQGSPRSPSPSPRDVMRGQWDLLLEVIGKLEGMLAYAEERGWTLLVAAVGAEISVYYDAKEVLRSMLRSMGLSPRERSPVTTPPAQHRQQQQQSSTSAASNGVTLVDMDAVDVEDRAAGNNNSNASSKNAHWEIHEELSGSVIRRWEDPDHQVDPQQQQQQQQRQTGDQQRSNVDNNPLSSSPASVPSDLISGVGGGGRRPSETDTDDNEVPAGLLNEASAHRSHEESDDEHHPHQHHGNEIPHEFLSLHASRNGNDGMFGGKLETGAGRNGDGHTSPDEHDHERGLGLGLGIRHQYTDSSDNDNDNDHDHDHDHDHENGVPLDLLSERRRGDDGGVD